MLANALLGRTVAVPKMPDDRFGDMGWSRPGCPVAGGTQHDPPEVFVDHPGKAGGVGDARVLLLHDVVAVCRARALGALDQTGRWLGQGEGLPSILAGVYHHAARKFDGCPTSISHASRPVAGVYVGPQAAVAHHQGVRFSHRQAGVGDIDHKLGVSRPQVGQRRRTAGSRMPGIREGVAAVAAVAGRGVTEATAGFSAPPLAAAPTWEAAPVCLG
jgi:hypothetical protein